MILGVTYNVFSDSVELLKASIENIRSEVDKVVVVTQLVSNFKEPCKPSLMPYLEHLKELNLIDKIVEFEPVNFGHQFCHKNETEKRNIGKSKLYEMGCTHFLSMDSDEFYDINLFKEAKRFIEERNFDTTFVTIQDYHLKPEYRINGLANYFVPFIHSIMMTHRTGTIYPAYCDPTRVVQTWRNPSQIDCTMHHMTTIRNDLYAKYKNSSANINFSNIEGMVERIKNFTPDMTEPSVTVVEDIFKVNDSISYFNKFEAIYQNQLIISEKEVSEMIDKIVKSLI